MVRTMHTRPNEAGNEAMMYDCQLPAQAFLYGKPRESRRYPGNLLESLAADSVICQDLIEDGTGMKLAAFE